MEAAVGMRLSVPALANTLHIAGWQWWSGARVSEAQHMRRPQESFGKLRVAACCTVNLEDVFCLGLQVPAGVDKIRVSVMEIRHIPSLRCGVFRRSVSTHQFVDPSPQLAGAPFGERPCGDTGATRQEPL